MVSEDKKVIQVINPKTGKEEILAISSSMNLRISKKVKERDNLLYENMEIWKKTLKFEEEKFVSKSLDRLSDLREKVNEVKYSDQDLESKKKVLSTLMNKIGELTDALPEKYKSIKTELVENDEKIEALGYEIINNCFRVAGGIPENYDTNEQFMNDIIEETADINFLIDFFLTHSTSYTKSRSAQRFKVVKK